LVRVPVPERVPAKVVDELFAPREREPVPKDR
jgi:hypothetical protein